MPRYRRKPTVVEAYVWQPGLHLPGIEEIELNEPAFHTPRIVGRFRTIHAQDTFVSPGQVVIKESDGVHWYPCDPAIFASTYEVVEE